MRNLASPLPLKTGQVRSLVMGLKALGLMPWIVLLVGMPLMNRAEPLVLGLPLPLAWATGCTLLSAATLFVIYRLDEQNRHE